MKKLILIIISVGLSIIFLATFFGDISNFIINKTQKHYPLSTEIKDVRLFEANEWFETDINDDLLYELGYNFIDRFVYLLSNQEYYVVFVDVILSNMDKMDLYDLNVILNNKLLDSSCCIDDNGDAINARVIKPDTSQPYTIVFLLNKNVFKDNEITPQYFCENFDNLYSVNVTGRAL